MKDLVFDSASKSDRLKEMIRESILQGTLKPGEQIPSEPDMIARYHVSRGPIREAIASLVHEGLLYRQQGKGTYVAERPLYRPTIAVVMPYLFFHEASPYSAGTDVMPRLMQAIETEARRLGMSLLLYLDNHEPQVERENIASLLERKVEGVILNYIGVDENLDCVRLLEKERVPLVMVDRYVEGLDLDYVVTDNVLGAYRATLNLIAQGCRTLIYITSPILDTTLRDRHAGYQRALAESGLAPSVLTIDTSSARTDPETTRAYRLLREWLKTGLVGPLGFLTADAPILVGVWQALEEANIAHDYFALACFDDPFLSLPSTVRLTRVLQPLPEIGRRSVTILQQKFAATPANGAPAGSQIRLEPEIVTTGGR